MSTLDDVPGPVHRHTLDDVPAEEDTLDTGLESAKTLDTGTEQDTTDLPGALENAPTELEKTADYAGPERESKTRVLIKGEKPQFFGDFRIVRPLGVGGMATVMEVRYDPQRIRARIRERVSSELPKGDLDELVGELVEGMPDEVKQQVLERAGKMRDPLERRHSAELAKRVEQEFEARKREIAVGLGKAFSHVPRIAELNGVSSLTRDIFSIPLALKRLNDTHIHSEAGRERFKWEGHILGPGGKVFKHPQWVKVFEHGEIDGVPYYVSEVLPGEVRSDRAYSVDEALFIVEPMAAALQFAHENGIVHRDLKPDNVRLRVSEGGCDLDVVVTDLGIARDQSRKTMTVQDSIIGTPVWMSPEQASSLPVDARSDIYALGAVLYNLLTGSPPDYESKFNANDPVSRKVLSLFNWNRTSPKNSAAKKMLMNSGKEDVVRRLNDIGDLSADLLHYPRELNPSVPKELENVILKMMEKDPARRYQTMAEVREDLAAVSSHSILRPEGSPKPKVRKVSAPSYNFRRVARTARKNFWKTLTCTALAAAIGLGSTLYYRHTQTLEYLVARAPPAANHAEMERFSERLQERLVDAKVRPLASRISPPAYPFKIAKGTTDWHTIKGDYYMSACWPSMLLQSYEITGDAFFLEQADRYLADIAKHRNLETDSLGFLFERSFVKSYEITGREEHAVMALSAADNLAELYDDRLGFLCASRSSRSLNVETMRKAVPLLLWAHESSGKQKYLDMAVQHARSTARHCVLADGSTFHAVEVDPDTQSVTRVFSQLVPDGSIRSSRIARPHAMAADGFISVYEHTHEKEFIDVAEELMDYYLVSVGREGEWAYIPPFDLADSSGPRDSSAGAVYARNLQRLSEVHPDEAKRAFYREAAVSASRSLLRCLDSTSSYPAILRYATGNTRDDTLVEGSLILADSYFLELLD